MNDYITTANQSTIKPCACFLAYTVYYIVYSNVDFPIFFLFMLILKLFQANSIGLRLFVVACVCLCVWVCVYPSLCRFVCQRDNLILFLATIIYVHNHLFNRLNQKMQNNLVKSWLVFGVYWPWPSRSNLTRKSNFTKFWVCSRDNSLTIQPRITKFWLDVHPYEMWTSNFNRIFLWDFNGTSKYELMGMWFPAESSNGNWWEWMEMMGFY